MLPALSFAGPEPVVESEIEALMRATADRWQRSTNTEERELWVSVETVASSVSSIAKTSVSCSGESLFLELVAEALRRQKALDSIPLILDNPFSGFLDGEALQRICKLLVELGRRSQILLLTSRSAELADMLGDDAVSHDWLERPKTCHFSQIS